MNFVLFFISFVFIEKFLRVLTKDCVSLPSIGKICANKFYDPKDLLIKEMYENLDITFLKLRGNVNLSIPKELSGEKDGSNTFTKFYVAESCVEDIQEGYFNKIDKNKKSLTEITFKSVTCLKKLLTKSFQGTGDYLKQLTFESMLDLEEVDEDFFDSFLVLEKLTIINTSIQALPLWKKNKMPKLIMVNITNNKLTDLPQIPFERKDLIGKVYAYNNPFHCQCSLKPMADVMKAVLSPDLYKCGSPEKHKGKALIDVDYCGEQISTKVFQQKINNKVVATAHVRIEIIIAVSLFILVLVVIIIVVVLYKRHTKKKAKPVYERTSPSKIVYQNEIKEAFLYKNEA